VAAFVLREPAVELVDLGLWMLELLLEMGDRLPRRNSRP